MSIADWPKEQRPRERLLALGPAALSDAELLAIFLRVGLPGKNAVELARETLQRFGSLDGVFHAVHRGDVMGSGLGPAKCAQLRAAMELSRRVIHQELKQGATLDSTRKVGEYLKLMLRYRERECFVILFLDTRNKLICMEEMFSGTVNQSAVYPREVVKAALRNNAAAVILAHNHPSGDPEPSDADLALTHALTGVLELMDVRLLDHFVVAGTQLYSFADHGRL